MVSHLPQVAASLVAARLREVPEAAVALAGQGVRDVTRIAASDPVLWTQILAGNASAVRHVLQLAQDDLARLVASLDALADGALGSGDVVGARGVVATLVAQGNEGHARIPGKHGAAPTTYAQVPVLVPDRPGELARLLADVGESGVNLEDLRLEHSQGQPVGLAEISSPAGRRSHARRGACRSRVERADLTIARPRLPSTGRPHPRARHAGPA